MPDPGSVPDTFEEMEQARKGTFLGRINQTFQDVLVTSRGTGRERAPAVEAGEDPAVTADDLAIRRARTVKLQRMVVPEGVIIDGSMTSGSETEIAGRIEGDVTVEGRLLLEGSALISGNVRATACKVEGLVEGKMECSEELELGQSGRLNADVVVGKRLILSGQVFGNISCGGSVRLTSTARVSGDIRARALVMELGAVFNGFCRMRAPVQRTENR
jgi:cytoskeletal protein CcmA (bactofilin family)